MGNPKPTDREKQIGKLLEAGYRQVEICEKLGVSPSVVSRRALRLGFTRSVLPTRYDWEAIRAYYETGHTARKCRLRFGYSAGAWDQAISRGDIVLRDAPDPKKHSHVTRNAVRALLEAGKNQARIAAELGISKGTVGFHVRKLGVRPDQRFRRRYNWNEIQRAHDSGLSMRACASRFGFSSASWHQAVRRGELVPRSWVIPLEDLLVIGRRTSRSHLKRRLLREGVKQNRCEHCGISEWQGRPLNMQLHHVNGDGTDNRLENIRFLCGNCHSQTDTYGGRNGHRRPAAPARSEA